MKESYRKGIANHPGPSHARAVERPHLKRWTEVHAGFVLNSEIVHFQGPTVSCNSKGNR
jgi:hypothetical protein